MIFDIKNFSYTIICEQAPTDTLVETVVNDNTLDLFVTATKDKLKFIELRWDFESCPDLYVLGDVWERSYGELEFAKLKDCTRYFPWYFIATDKEKCWCFGVKTQPNAFVSFRYTEKGITALVDCRNGGNGVHLNGRKLHLATFVYAKFDSADATASLHAYCKMLCDNPILPSEPVYGGNNWYYAYGKSSYEQIASDARFQAELAKGINNRPFQVIDDGWQINPCSGPWIVNDKFRDMKQLADEIRASGARPGIWIRLLETKDEKMTPDMRIHRSGKRQYLDPTIPAVQEYIKADIEMIKNWGYELLKHDFTTADLFGNYGNSLNETVTKVDDWHFYDQTKTNAEITLDFYRLIKETAGNMYLIGCNTISHLCAGLVELNRIGDDTSGREWARTRKMGINTLAFRLAQNEAFYMCDADCVGILDNNIPWELNKQFLHLLSYSNTPLFVSCTDQVTEEQKKDLAEAYNVFRQKHTIRPLDIYENKTPSQWEIDGATVVYNWEE
ncbi:MAG: hypothetical protein IKJ63_03860 [Clostridia bacterium]|nr:hypothetical protein [Clostridia bacterium]